MLKIGNNEIKLIISDFDGTLRAEHNKAIGSQDIQAIRTAIDNGAMFVINTGNAPFEMQKTMELIKPIGDDHKYILVCNGNGIYNYASQECKSFTSFTQEEMHKILQIVQDYNLIYDLTSEDLNYVYYSDDNFLQSMIEMNLSDDDHIHRLILTDEILQNFGNCAKITFHNANFDKKAEFVEFVKQALPELNIYGTWFSQQGLDLGIAGPNKYKAMVNLVEIINDEHNLTLTLDNVIYFGDQHNDYEVFKNHKYCIAVANAADEIKQIAYDTTLSAADCGVGAYLRKITQ